MNIARIIELQMLAEHIKFLRDKSDNDADLINQAKDAYKIIAEQIGIIYIPKEESE